MWGLARKELQRLYPGKSITDTDIAVFFTTMTIQYYRGAQLSDDEIIREFAISLKESR